MENIRPLKPFAFSSETEPARDTRAPHAILEACDQVRANHDWRSMRGRANDAGYESEDPAAKDDPSSTVDIACNAEQGTCHDARNSGSLNEPGAELHMAQGAFTGFSEVSCFNEHYSPVIANWFEPAAIAPMIP